MYKDVEQKLDAITDSLRQDLLKSGAINDKEEIVKPQTFIDIIEHKENQVNKLFAMVEKDGVVADKNGANLIYSRLHILSDMKEKMSMSPYVIDFETHSDKTQKQKKTRHQN